MSDIIWGTVTKIISTNSFEMNVSHQKDTNQDSYQDVEEINFTEIDIPSIPADENSRNVSQIEEKSVPNSYFNYEIYKKGIGQLNNEEMFKELYSINDEVHYEAYLREEE